MWNATWYPRQPSWGRLCALFAARPGIPHLHDENLGALTLDFTATQPETLDAAADAVVGSRSANPAWVSEGRE
jgi:hypothetical protein